MPGPISRGSSHRLERDRRADTRNCQSTEEGGTGSTGSRWRSSQAFSGERKLNQGLEVKEEGEARASWEGKFLESWDSQERRRDFREVWDVIGAQQRPGVGVPLGVPWGLGRAGGLDVGVTSQRERVRGGENQSLWLGVGERNRSPTGGRETGVPSREERQVSSPRGQPVRRLGVRCLGAAADPESS